MRVRYDENAHLDVALGLGTVPSGGCVSVSGWELVLSSSEGNSTSMLNNYLHFEKISLYSWPKCHASRPIFSGARFSVDGI